MNLTLGLALLREGAIINTIFRRDAAWGGAYTKGDLR